jgi:hypothetical protein
MNLPAFLMLNGMLKVMFNLRIFAFLGCRAYKNTIER